MPIVGGNLSWKPQDIVNQTQDEESNKLRTEWGNLKTWDFEFLLVHEGWENIPPEFEKWGKLPIFKSIKELRRDSYGIWLKLEGRNTPYTALVLPYLATRDISNLARHTKISKACLESEGLHLPMSGLMLDDCDAMLVWEGELNFKLPKLSKEKIGEIASKLGKLVSNLAEFSTPNNQAGWNNRLKNCEADLNVNTLWRAPHSSDTVGLPWIGVSLEYYDSGLSKFVSMPPKYTEFLTMEAQRLPAFSWWGRVEGDLVSKGLVDAKDLPFVFDLFAKELPKNWTSKAAMSTYAGGLWIWRYEDILLRLAHARAYGYSEMESKCKKWLDDVDRMQAKMGVSQMFRSMNWVAAFAVVSILYSQQNDWISQMSGNIGIGISLLVAVLGTTIYKLKDPSPF